MQGPIEELLEVSRRRVSSTKWHLSGFATKPNSMLSSRKRHQSVQRELDLSARRVYRRGCGDGGDVKKPLNAPGPYIPGL
jgi:hypothetical protein